MDCPDYAPGEVMGRERPICKYYNKSNNGSCNRQDHVMCCVVWVAKTFNGKIVEVKDAGN